jgi:hypothetical protein
MFEERVLVAIATLCLAMAAWTVHLHPTTSYVGVPSSNSGTAIMQTSCISVWDLWTDTTSPAPIELPKNYVNANGPDNPQRAQLACGATIVGREHVAETWAAGSLVLLLIAGGLALRLWATEFADELINRPR